MKIILFLILSIICIVSVRACYYIYKATIRIKELKKERHDLLEHISELRELDNDYREKVQEYDELIEKKNNQLDQVKNILVLAAQQALAEKEKKDQELFYRLSLTEQDINDIQILNQIKSKVSQPTVLSKLIWTTYIQKPTNALCLRLTKGKTITGIYKITNLLTSQVYVGQSVDISSRIKQHIKAGLGINCTSLNKLYSSMQSDGVYNFKYEILECI